MGCRSDGGRDAATSRRVVNTIDGELADQLRLSVGSWRSARTLPPDCYVSEAVQAAERQAIFGQGWVGVGRSDRWPHAGDFAAVDISGVPIVIVRDSSGELRALANTCSHRASQIVTGEGNARRLRCPFHYWTYDLGGRLVAAPSMADTPGFDGEMADLCLTSYPLVEWHGFVMVSLEPNPVAIDDWYSGFAELHQPWPVGDLVTVRRREFTVSCDWKAFAEVFNEYYHLPYVHPSSIDDIYLEPDEPEEVQGAFATQFGLTDGTGGLLSTETERILPTMPGLDGRAARGVRYTWLFPNIVIALGAEVMWMYEVYPDGVGRCRCAQVVAAPAATLETGGFQKRIEAYCRRFDLAIDEDIPVLEQQHRGQRSPHGKRGRYSYLEPCVAKFGDWYARRLLAGPPSPLSH